MATSKEILEEPFPRRRVDILGNIPRDRARPNYEKLQ